MAGVLPVVRRLNGSGHEAPGQESACARDGREPCAADGAGRMISAVPRPVVRLQFGPFTLVPVEHVLMRDGQPIALTPKAFDLLVFLVANPGRLLTKDELLEVIWPDAVVEESNLAYHVSAIRKALGDAADAGQYIETVPKRGYRFVATVVPLDEAGDEPQLQRPSAIASAASLADTGEAHADGDRRAARVSRESPAWRLWTTGAVCLAIGVAGATAFRVGPSMTTAAPELRHFSEPLWGVPAEGGGTVSVSPDGRNLAMAIQGSDGVARLWVRSLAEPAPHPLPGTETFFAPPVFWASGDTIVFGNGGPLKSITLPQGTPRAICELPSIAVGGSWSRAGSVLVGNPLGPMLHCPAAGGPATPVTRPERPSEIHLMPSFLPDGRHFIYLRVDRAAPERTGAYIGTADNDGTRPDTYLLTTGFNVIYVLSADARLGLVVFVRDGALFAQRFDDRRLELVGEPMPLGARVGSFIDHAFFSASPQVLVYREPDPDYQLTWFDRTGREIRRIGSPEPIDGLALSPSGARALIVKHTPVNVADQDLWLVDLEGQSNTRRQTFAPVLEAWPAWLSDDRFAYGGTGADTTVYEQAVGGPPGVWFDAGADGRVSIAVRGGGVNVAADGGGLAVFSRMGAPATRLDIWARTEHGPPSGAPLITREADQAQSQLSPDGTWLAYVSNETGRNEVFLARLSFDATSGTITAGESLPVSDGGGFAPRWSGDGRELLYLKTDGSVMAVDVDPHAGAVLPTTRRLFGIAGVFPDWGLTADGRRLLFAVPVAPASPLHILHNWQSALPN